MFGLWLGDGHTRNSRISIGSADPLTIEKIQRWAEREGYTVSFHKKHTPNCQDVAIFPNTSRENLFFKEVSRNFSTGEKRICRQYLVNSRENRLQLLAGLIDSDGYADRSGFEICTKHDGLKDDIVYLARSLGFRVSASQRTVKCQSGEFLSWRIFIAGDVSEIPTLRKKCGEKTLRTNSDCVGIEITPDHEGDWVGFSVDGNHRFLLGDFTVTHNSDPFALWVVVNFMVDPTHVKALVMSTTLDGAKLRIWKTVREYVSALPDFPGKPLWSTNRIAGPNYDEDGFGESSGILLLASEKSREKEALEKMIGIKSPRTGAPDYSLDGLKRQFPDLAATYDNETLVELLPRLTNLAEDRIGKLILVVDEATGLPESLLNAINLNMKPGNVGSLQVIMLGNPNLHWDSFGRFCQPKIGWDKVTLDDYEWETITGGKLVRFNGEINPRITERNDLFSWMLTTNRIEGIAKDCGGKDSLGYWRMVLGMWSPEGSESGVYSQADVEAHGAMSLDRVKWAFSKPTVHSALDCSFSADGDRAFCTFGLLGIDTDGRQVLEIIETTIIEIDISNTQVPVNYQIARKWRKECEARRVPPENACFDSSGAGLVFADIVSNQWSPLVQGISAAGKPLKKSISAKDAGKGGTKDNEVTFANRATQLWYGAHPYFRAGQIRGVTPALAKEICSRQHEKTNATDGRTLKIEGKRVYKARVGISPDESDSFFLLVEHCRAKHKFRHSDKPVEVARGKTNRKGAWSTFADRARRITHKKNLRR